MSLHNLDAMDQFQPSDDATNQVASGAQAPLAVATVSDHQASRTRRSGAQGGVRILEPNFKRPRQRIETNPIGIPLDQWVSSTGPSDASSGPNVPVHGLDPQPVAPVVRTNNVNANAVLQQVPRSQLEQGIVGQIARQGSGGHQANAAARIAGDVGNPASVQHSAAASPITIPAPPPRPRQENAIPQFPAFVHSNNNTGAVGNDMQDNVGNYSHFQSVACTHPAFDNNTSSAGCPVPCLMIDNLSIVRCEGDCGQYLLMRDIGKQLQVQGHISKDTILSLFQDFAGQLQGGSGRESTSQEQSPSEELAHGVGNMAFRSQNSQWATPDSSSSSSPYSSSPYSYNSA
ncbi:hypothetical protein SCHPADRAFT_942290 [Schizopora paradoxa]|uniref:Uncharacterized protein n=1 Tax=Schizopora paradoxa TaxID=27342 RepID=A0A0H2RHT1_9AGAM|nr:hypothetical protein SCHPADRAFT_942290 [Schizopora paradoxa]